MDEPDPATSTEAADAAADDVRGASRLQLLLDVIVFQFKLAADGLRDVLLSPLSVLSALLGLIAGGDDPYRYFRRLLRFGRRTEVWINLFGYRSHAGTSDELIAPLKERVVTEARNNPWLSRAGSQLNRTLDSVEERLGNRDQPTEQGQKPEQDSGLRDRE